MNSMLASYNEMTMARDHRTDGGAKARPAAHGAAF
jgi:hypothetical protein